VRRRVIQSAWCVSPYLSFCLVPEQLTLGVFSFSFGIFRLTDPPGLSTILECKEKEAFHPHPDLPIYTVRLSC